MTKSKSTTSVKGKTSTKRLTVGKTDTTENIVHRFPVVGIGASAGGLEALELFLDNTPVDSGMAYVIIQHLNPTHKGMMVELLQRHTRLPVTEVADRMRVLPNNVYVIPPNKDMSILRGVLHLHDPTAARGLRLPVDFFFRALADDQQERSIGLILSGMGSDGTLGLRAIKDHAGATFVQDPASAKFDGMPRSAINAGLADVIGPVEALPGKIRAYLSHVPGIALPSEQSMGKAHGALENAVVLIRSHTGHDFSQYKKNTLFRRIERRMGLHHIGTIESYIRFLQENEQEVDFLFRELLIGVTRFFRDAAVWELLKNEVLLDLVGETTQKQTIRAWVPACSTGEEAYTLAILLQEALEQRGASRNVTIQIFATDLDPVAIDKARAGIFPMNIAADISEERLDRFFVEVDNGYKVQTFLRELVIFAPQNVIMDPPFTKLDLLSCRNLLIYLTPDLQRKLLDLFHYSLNPQGVLFLGNAETIGNQGNLFSSINGKARLYRRIQTTLRTIPADLSSTYRQPHERGTRARTETASLQSLAEELLLTTFSPAAVLTSATGDILYVSGRTGKFLEAPVGKANWNIFAMAREELRYELHQACKQAQQRGASVVINDLHVASGKDTTLLRVTVRPIENPERLRGSVMYVFHETTPPPSTEKGRPEEQKKTNNARFAELEMELVRAKRATQSMHEELRSMEEECKSAQEELQSTNEELQSTNEELTTSKEEMQSMNEELQTINHELQVKVDELSSVNNDMRNLLDSTDIATLFLDNNLCVRRFTNQTSKITRLISADVGRPITDIASDLLYPELAQDVREVLRTLMSAERQIVTTEKTWFAVRIKPYRTLQDVIDGVVITFMNITDYKSQEAELRATELRLRKLLKNKE